MNPPRPTYLPRNRSHRLAPAQQAVHLIIFVTIFALVFKVWVGLFHWPAWWLLLGVAVVIAICLVTGGIQHDRRLKRMAFETWVDQCVPIARQYGIEVEPPGRNYEWWKRWNGGLTPNEAVQQERDARELGQ